MKRNNPYARLSVNTNWPRSRWQWSFIRTWIPLWGQCDSLKRGQLVEKGHTLLMKEAYKFAEELGTSLSLEYPQPSCWSVSDPETEIKGPKVKEHLKKANMEKLKEKINDEKWQGRFLQVRWQDSKLSQSGCFAWLHDWTCAPTHTIAGVMDLWAAHTH